jgi:hypothetical protein
MNSSSTLMCLLLLMSAPDCVGHGAPAPAAASNVALAPDPTLPVSPSGQTGTLIVYSATYPQTLEQSEYPAHTNYTIATPDDKVIDHVTNATGSFNSRPARVSLPPGKYHVRAQYSGGRFVTVPVVIEPDKTTIVDLDAQASIPTGM